MTSRTRGFLDWDWASIFAPRSSNAMEGGCGSKAGKASARPSFLPSPTHQRAIQENSALKPLQKKPSHSLSHSSITFLADNVPDAAFCQPILSSPRQSHQKGKFLSVVCAFVFWTARRLY